MTQELEKELNNNNELNKIDLPETVEITAYSLLEFIKAIEFNTIKGYRINDSFNSGVPNQYIGLYEVTLYLPRTIDKQVEEVKKVGRPKKDS